MGDKMSLEQLRAWLHAIIAGIVTEPERIELRMEQDEMGTKFTVSVGKFDRGKVIGKKGATADALRTLLRNAGFLAGVRASLMIEIPGERPFAKAEEEPGGLPDPHDQRKAARIY